MSSDLTGGVRPPGRTSDGQGTRACRIPESISRRSELRCGLVQTTLAGRFHLPWLRRAPRGDAEKPAAFVRMPRLGPTNLDHSGPGDASLQAAVDGMVLGRAFQAAHSNAMPARQLEDQSGDTCKTAWLLTQKLRRSIVDPDREPLEGAVEADQTEIPFREGDVFLDRGNAGKIRGTGAVEVIDRDTNPSKPRILCWHGKRRCAQNWITRRWRLCACALLSSSKGRRLRQEYPKIKALARKEKAGIYFGGAGHIRSDHHAGRTWERKAARRSSKRPVPAMA